MSENPQEPNQADGRSSAGSGKAKRKPKPTSKAKNRKKKIKKRYSSAREEAQLAGIIPTTPDGAVRDEQVPSSAQSEQSMPELIIQAIRNGWAVPDERKPKHVDELSRILDDPKESAKNKITAFNALRMADTEQFNRDHPEAKTKGDTIIGNINIQNNMQAAAVVREMIERGELGILEEVQPADQPSALGNGRQQRQMDTSATPASDEQRPGEGMADTE